MNDRPPPEPADAGEAVGAGGMSSMLAAITVIAVLVFLGTDLPVGSLIGAIMFGTGVGGLIAFAHFMLLGLPLYLMLSRRMAGPIWLCGLAGAVIAGLPLTILLLVATVGGLSEQAPSILTLAGAGALAGLFFGRVMRPLTAIDEDVA